MVSIRHGCLVVVLALSLVAACKKSDTAAGDKSSASAGDDLSLLPVDSELVLGINVAQVQQSALWKKLAEPKLMTPDVVTKVNEIKTKCGFDPMTAIKTVSVGLKHLTAGAPDGVVVVHGPDKAKSMSCLDTVKDDLTKDGTEYTKDGDVGLMKNTKTGQVIAFTFLNDNTVVAVTGSGANAAGVKAAAAGGSVLKTSPQFVDMYSKVKTSDSLWLFMNGTSKALEMLAAFGVKPQAVFGSVNVTDGLTVDMRMRLDTPDAASGFAKMLKSQADQMASMVDKAEVTSDAADVRVSVAVSNQKLEGLLAKGMFGGMGGQ